MPNFSERNNLRTTNIPIVIRNDAQDDFRMWLIGLAKQVGLPIDTIRRIVCQKTYQAEDPNNWSPNEYMENETKEKLINAAWYYVYDVAEVFYISISSPTKKQEYASELNTYFQTNGYGWKFENGQVLFRGSEVEEQAFANAVQSLSTNRTAQNELKLALYDLSKRPTADTTGAVHHAMAAVECLCRDKFNAQSQTLGAIIQRNRSAFVRPIDDILEKLWGFASNHARHVQTGGAASEEDAELVLNLCSSLITYLSKTLP